MLKTVLVTLVSIVIAVVVTARSSTPTASAAVPASTTITWLCCDYMCSTNGGPSHGTSFCHASSIGTECPNTPAPTDASQECTLISQRPAEGCEDCVSQNP